ncbi:MAG: hypothetical protein EOO09_10180 [Chitinophagaceae bacterium]|nr:MAG: hypothetical protein EOO09_10180 [Chitinophagaceae bacterium]
MKIFQLIARKAFIPLLVLCCTTAHSQSACSYPAILTANVIPPINETLTRMVMSGNVRGTIRIDRNCVFASVPPFYVTAKIERITGGTPFTIRRTGGRYTVPVNADYNPMPISTAAMMDAFGNNDPTLLAVSGINRNAVIDANNNIVLPEGTYRLCLSAMVSSPAAVNLFYPASDSTTGCTVFVVPPANQANSVVINTRFTPPANPDIFQALSRGNVIPTVLYNGPAGRTTEVKLFGKIESLSPRPFTIETRPDFNTQQLLQLQAGLPVTLGPGQVADAFANFNPGDLKTTGISLDQLRDKNNNVILPEGVYRICFYAQFWKDGLVGLASNINLGCATFNICNKAGAPQFSQPVSNFTVSNALPVVRVTSPVVFAWTPPVATCGLNMSSITYDFEIREIFASQTVTDAINNPPVFRKTGLRSPSFLLDTMLYKQVLQRGQTYVIRVKANTAFDAAISIDNGGYSRVQAFRYGDVPAGGGNIKAELNPRGTKTLIATSQLKGRAVWTFKKTEEELLLSASNGILTAEVTANTINQPVVQSTAQKNEGIKAAIDPNYRVVSAQLNGTSLSGNAVQAVNNSNAAAPSSPALLARAMGDGETTELKDLKIPATGGSKSHPLAGASVFIKAVRSTGSGQTLNRVASDNPAPAPGVPLSTQLGMVTAASFLPVTNPAAGNNSATRPNGSVQLNQQAAASLNSLAPNLLFIDESKLEEDLLASGTTDASGNFILNFIDPKFKSIRNYSQLHVVIEHPDFERYSKFMAIGSPDAPSDLDLGEVKMLAKTYRYTPRIEGLARDAKIDLYSPAAAFTNRPYYNEMVRSSSNREKLVIAGREYIKIATLGNNQTISQLFYQQGSNENFIIRISAKNKEQYTAYMGLLPMKYSRTGLGGGTPVDESKMVIGLVKKYKLKNELPYIQGKVELFIDDKHTPSNSSTIPVKGATVTVSFDKSKVLEEYKETVQPAGAPGSTTSQPGAGVGNAPVGFVNGVSATRSFTGVTVNNVVNSSATGTVTATAGNRPAVVAGASNVSFNPQMRLVNEVNPGIGAQLHTIFRYSAVTDADGNYRIDKLPVLQEGSFFTVTVRTPDDMDSSAKTTRPLARGDYDDMNFQFRPEVYTVTGIAVDESGAPLTDAILVWKSGGSPVEAAKNGLFITSAYKSDSLAIKNQGYISKSIFVNLDKSKLQVIQGLVITKQTATDPVVVNKTGMVNSWVTSLTSLPSVQAASKPATTTGNAPAAVQPVSAGTFGYAVSTSASQTVNAQFVPMFRDLFPNNQLPAGAKDLGKVGFLVKGSAKVKFVVSDAGSQAKVANAVIRVDDVFDTLTGNNGEVIYKSGGGAFTYTVAGPAGSEYIIQSGELGTLPVDGSTSTVTVSLEKGIRISGKVSSAGKNIDNAEIFIDGREFITTRSKADGSYQLFIPKGENTIKATRQGYIGKQVTKTYNASSTENFELGDGGGKNISRLLGFDIELESQQPDGAGEKWTGSFVNLKANTVFSVSGSKKIHFTNVRVTFDGSGNPVAAGNEVKTDLTELPVKLFGYLPVAVKGIPQITVREQSPGKGTIGGRLQLNTDQMGMAGGFVFGNLLKPLLVAPDGPADKDVPVFTADGSAPAIAAFAMSAAREDLKRLADQAVADFQPKLNGATGEAKTALQNKLNELKAAAATAATLVSGSAPIPASLGQYLGVDVFGFQAMVNLSKTKVESGGISFAGFILSPSIPIMSAMFFDIERLKLGTDFAVKDVSVSSTLAVKFSIASWSAEVNNVSFSMRGFKVGGKIEVQIPQSPKSTMEFANLAFGTSGLYGGSFSFPGNGLNVFNIISLKTGGTPLSFGEVGNSGVYKLGGSAKFGFGKLFSDNIEVPYFQIQTNGQFGVTVPVNRSLNTGFAKFALNSITFNTTTPTPQIDLDGKFSVDVKLISLSAGGIHFRTSGVSVDKIGLGLDIPGTKIDGYLDIKDNGFAGGGNLSVIGTPVKVKIDFHYYKTPGGVDLGAYFIAGVKIPIGPVIITKVGGGFTYRSNPEFFSVTITGGASITGLEELISLDPISITVESGPKLVGEAHVKVGPLDVAQAKLVLDVPNEYFALGIVADFEPLPDMVRAHVQGDLIVSTKSSDTYFFFGAGMDVNLFGLIRSEGVFALGFGVKNAKTRETISYYMSKAPSEYLSNGTFTGVYVNGVSEMGVKKEDAPGLDLGVISGKIWLHTRSDFSFIANFDNANFRVSAGMSFQGGIRGCFTFICAEASAKACVNVSGGYNNSQGWNFNASASGEAVLAAGSSCGCNDICIGFVYAGGKVCVGAGARIRYESRSGGLKELSMFIGNRSSCP